MFLFTTKGRSPVRGNSDRMREAGGAGTKELSNTVQGVVPTPPGIVMVAPPEAPRNAEGAQRRPRCRTTEVGNNATNNTSIIKAGTPRRMPRPAWYRGGATWGRLIRRTSQNSSSTHFGE